MVYQKIKYTQFQDYISFKLIEEKSYSVMNCKIEQQNRTAIKDIQYPNIKKCSIWLKEHNLYIKIVTKINYESKFGQNWTKN